MVVHRQCVSDIFGMLGLRKANAKHLFFGVDIAGMLTLIHTMRNEPDSEELIINGMKLKA